MLSPGLLNTAFSLDAIGGVEGLDQILSLAQFPQIHLQQVDLGSAPLEGIGTVAGHLGEIVQIGANTDGDIGIISLSCNAICSTARVKLTLEDPTIRVAPEGRKYAERAARFTLDALGLPNVGAEVTIEERYPLGSGGKGTGTSSCNPQSVIVAMGRACGVGISKEQVIQISYLAEGGATDPLIYGNEAHIFYPRRGFSWERIGMMPLMEVFGFDADPDSSGVDTQGTSPSYTANDVKIFAELVELVRYGIQYNDINVIAKAATASAALNQRFEAVRIPSFFEIANYLIEEAGALGVVAGHTGTVMGGIFPATALKSDVDFFVGLEHDLRNRFGIVSTAHFNTTQISEEKLRSNDWETAPSNWTFEAMSSRPADFDPGEFNGLGIA